MSTTLVPWHSRNEKMEKMKAYIFSESAWREPQTTENPNNGGIFFGWRTMCWAASSLRVPNSLTDKKKVGGRVCTRLAQTLQPPTPRPPVQSIGALIDHNARHRGHAQYVSGWAVGASWKGTKRNTPCDNPSTWSWLCFASKAFLSLPMLTLWDMLQRTREAGPFFPAWHQGGPRLKVTWNRRSFCHALLSLWLWLLFLSGAKMFSKKICPITVSPPLAEKPFYF